MRLSVTAPDLLGSDGSLFMTFNWDLDPNPSESPTFISVGYIVNGGAPVNLNTNGTLTGADNINLPDGCGDTIEIFFGAETDDTGTESLAYRVEYGESGQPNDCLETTAPQNSFTAPLNNFVAPFSGDDSSDPL